MSEGDVPALLREITSANPGQLLREGVDRRNRGDFAAAELALVASEIAMPGEWQAAYEIGLLYQLSRRPQEAVCAFERAFNRNRSAVCTLTRLIASYAAYGHHGRIADVMEHVDITDIEMLSAIREVSEFARFAARFPLVRAKAIWADATTSREQLSDVNVVAALISQALEDRKPFAMVRMGDGEGTWFHRDADEEAAFGYLYQRNRDEFWDIWFGADTRDRQGVFFREIGNILTLLQQADVVGIPPLSWIEAEYQVASLRGCSGTLNAVRAAKANSSPSAWFCSQQIHLDLEGSHQLQALVRSARRIGVFSCHPTIRDFLQDQFDARDVLFYGIPGEPSRRHLHGEETLTGEHFPTRFSELLAEIQRSDFSGHLFLVGGGILGKMYCLMLKEAGAVAIDIGSVADKWMGKKTRPGF